MTKEPPARPRGGAARRPRILYIDDRMPRGDLGAGLPRAHDILQVMLDLGYAVSVHPLMVQGETIEAADGNRLDVECLDAPAFADVADILRQRGSLYDVIWISRPHNIATVHRRLFAQGMSLRNCRHAVIVYDAEAVATLRDAMRGRIAGKPVLGAQLMAAITRETALYAQADAVVCVSPREERLFAHCGLRTIHVLGHRLAVRTGCPGFAARQGIVFTGNLMQQGLPNHDSIVWFVRAVWPLVREALGDGLVFSVVGAIDSSIAAAIAAPGVRVLGQVAQLDAVLDAARVAVAPTRFASGLPHKVHEAMSRGLPIVMTRLLAAQVACDAAIFAVADDPRAFAAAVVALHTDEARWNAVRDAGLGLIEATCGEAPFREAIRAICEPGSKERS